MRKIKSKKTRKELRLYVVEFVRCHAGINRVNENDDLMRGYISSLMEDLLR